MKEYRKCKNCKEKKLFKEFPTVITANNDIAAWCKVCHAQRVLLFSIRTRAKQKGLSCDLELDDIAPPEFCPVLGIRLVKSKGKRSDNSPSVDRINNKGGYTKDNIVVVSSRANRFKSDASLVEIRKMYEFYSQFEK